MMGTSFRQVICLTDTERDQLCETLERVERLAREHAELLAGCRAIVGADPDPLAEYRLADGTIGHMDEQARWVARGDVIQAAHGDTRWETVVSTVHADSQTGIVTDTGAGTRLRWWGHTDLVRVAAAPVPDPTPYR